MSLIVAVHGIKQEFEGAPKLVNAWWPSLKSGIELAGRSVPDNALACAFYGFLFRAAGMVRGPNDLQEESPEDAAFDRDLVMAMWHEAAKREPERVVSPTATVRSGVPLSVQAALNALSQSHFFTRIADHLMIGGLKQVRRYMHEPAIRLAAQESVNAVVTADTKVLIGHSLGSVVAYEALHRYADAAKWANVRTFVTLGSPLGIQNLIFHSLDPAPVQGQGKWPQLIKRWVNISDDHDVVALQKRLGSFFVGNIVDIGIDNGATAHDISPYLTSCETGEAIADGLA
jgi:hypothetical protein